MQKASGYKTICDTLTAVFSLLFTVLCIGAFNTYAEESDGTACKDAEAQIIRVAFPEVRNFSETDSDGSHTGLVVDYLNEISKYTNWRYEYVEGDSSELLEQLSNGEVDLMGGMFYDENLKTLYDYPEYNMSYNYGVLFALQDNKNVREGDLSSLNGKTIGVYVKAADKIERLQQYLEFNKIDCNYKYYKPEDLVNDSLYCYLERGEVDLLLGNDLEADGTFRIITEFPAQPYYFATTKGNKEVLEGLNHALGKIADNIPDFNEKHSSQFAVQESTQILLTQEEKEYVANTGSVKVAVIPDFHPFFCIGSEDSHDGIIPTVLKEVEKSSGLTFTYVFADNYHEMMELVKEGKADFAGCYYDSETLALEQGLALTVPYSSIDNILVKNKFATYPSEGLTAVVLKGRRLPGSIVADQVVYCDTTEEGLRMVGEQDADYMYGLSTYLDHQIQNLHFTDISVVTLNGLSSEISFALPRPVPTELLSILNKTIGSLTSKQLGDIVNQNLISAANNEVTLKSLIYSKPEQVIAISVVVLTLLSVFLYMGARYKVKNAVMAAELQRAEAENEAKSVFLSRMSHEIRTPMNAIVGLSELAARQEETPPEIKEYLIKIQAASGYLLALINDILDMSRIENGKMILTPEKFCMSVLLEEIQSIIQAQASSKNIICSFDRRIIHDCLIADSIRLKQVLVNLASNAVKFTPGGGKVEILVHELSDNGSAALYQFCVKDNGVGIALENQERIFDAFEQAGTSFSKSMGTGLGLPISKSIIEKMGDTIRLKSSLGEGTEFSFKLELKIYEGDSPVVQNTEKCERTYNFDGVRILLAEDNLLNAEIATELLAAQGAVVETAENGQAAFNRFSENRAGYYQLILMDLQMPVKNGLEATRDIRSSAHPDAKRIPIVAMTANSFKEDREAAENAGMNGFVSKPIDIQYLYQVMYDVLLDSGKEKEGSNQG